MTLSEAARILKWVALAAIVAVVFIREADIIPRWAMGLMLVPLVFAFMYFWQAASQKERDK